MKNLSKLRVGLTLLSITGLFAAHNMSALAEEAAGESEQLAVVHSGIPHDAVYDMVIRDKTGYAVGAFGSILETKDSGASWTKVDSGTDFALLGVAMSGDKRIIVGQRGTVLVGKADGGWEPGKSNTDKRLMKVDVNASGLAIAVGEFGTVMRSRDAGKTWEPLKLDWGSFREDGYEPHLYSVITHDSGRVIIAGEFSYVIVSNDGGDTWSLATKGEKSIFGMYLLPDRTGFAVGQEGLVLKTTDDGSNWQSVNANTDANLFGVWCSKQGEVVITGQRALLRSSDGGSTWMASKDLEVIRNWYVPIAVGEAAMKAPGGEMVSQVIYVAGHNGRIERVLQ